MNNSEKNKRANFNFMKPCCKQHNVFNWNFQWFRDYNELEYFVETKNAGWCRSKCEFIMNLAEFCRRKKFDERNSLSSHWNTRKNFLLMMIDFLNKVFPYFFLSFFSQLVKNHFFVFEMKWKKIRINTQFRLFLGKYFLKVGDQ